MAGIVEPVRMCGVPVRIVNIIFLVNGRAIPCRNPDKASRTSVGAFALRLNGPQE